jgi:plastocyanin
MSYTPATVTVQKNTNVKWTNDGGTAHTVTADNGTSFDSGSIPLNASFTLTPTVAGSYPYHCTIHGAAMAGTLVVTN